MRLLVATVTVLACAHAAAGQTRPLARPPSQSVERGYVMVGADWLVAQSAFAETTHPTDFVETATVQASYHISAAPGVVVGAGARVRRQFGIGIEVARVSGGTDTDVSAQVPHPLFFNRPRAVSGTAAGLDRTEVAIHLLASWTMPMSRRWQVAITGGPSWINVSQQLVSDVAITQTYPYDTATFAGVTKQQVTKGHVGVNAGAEAVYRTRSRAALVLGARFTHASVPLSPTAPTGAGGLHGMAGLRVHF